jgi:nicotinamide riboside transporter PnuC
MNNWRIVGKIATGFGIVCVVFAVFAAVIAYKGMNLNPGYYPVGTIQLAVLSSMLEYLFFAALSFVAAALSMRAGKESTEVETPPSEAESTETQA